MQATCAKTWQKNSFFKRYGKQHGRNMKATCAKTVGKHKVLETSWKATWTQHSTNTRKNIEKPRDIETFSQATWTQHAQKSWANTRFLKSFWKATCAKTWDTTRFPKCFCQATRTQHVSNMRKKPGASPGSGDVLESNMDATCKQHAQKPGKNRMKPTNPNADTYVDKQRQYLFVTFPTNSFVRHPEFTH